MDQASLLLAQRLPPNVPRTYAALAERGNVPFFTLHDRARGRPAKETKNQRQQYLTPQEEKAVVNFLLRMSSIGQPVRIKFIPRLVLSIARQRSAICKLIKPPGKNWARAFEKRHPELKARKVRAIDWKRHGNNIYDKITYWFEVIGEVLQDSFILPENVYNMDETGVMLNMLGSVKVLLGKDDPRDYRGVGVKRTMVTVIECISADSRSLLPLVIWPAATHRSNWTTYSTPGWHYAYSENGYNDSKISLEWLKRVFDPQTRERANQKPRILICDGFGTHETLEVLEHCFKNNIILCRLPSHTSHKLQPCDVGVFAPLKAAYREQVERLYRAGIDTVGKEHFTYLYKSARERAFIKRNIAASWAATGLFPFNPERVLRDIPQPPIELLKVDKMNAGACSQDETLRTPVTPVTPATPGTLAMLHNLIKQDAHMVDNTDKQRLQRRVQKLTSAAQISFAERALLQDQNRFLTKMNNEMKTRRSTKMVVLGKAKVMSYEDFNEARAKRAATDQVSNGKGKCGRKRKISVLNAGASGPDTKTVHMREAEPSGPPVTQTNIRLEQRRAPMAWMAGDD